MTAEEHMQAFMAYVAGMLADADRYLASGPADLVKDGATYRMAAMWLTDTEFAEFALNISSVFQPRLANVPGKGRRRRMIYSDFLPGREPARSADPGPE